MKFDMTTAWNKALKNSDENVVWFLFNKKALALLSARRDEDDDDGC